MASNESRRSTAAHFIDVIVDFTNNAAAILKAFAKYCKGAPFEPDEPDPELCTRLLADILAAGVFTQTDARDFVTFNLFQMACSQTDTGFESVHLPEPTILLARTRPRRQTASNIPASGR